MRDSALGYGFLSPCPVLHNTTYGKSFSHTLENVGKSPSSPFISASPKTVKIRRCFPYVKILVLGFYRRLSDHDTVGPGRGTPISGGISNGQGYSAKCFKNVLVCGFSSAFSSSQKGQNPALSPHDHRRKRRQNRGKICENLAGLGHHDEDDRRRQMVF